MSRRLNSPEPSAALAMFTIRLWNIARSLAAEKKSVGYHLTAVKLTEWKKEPEKALFYFSSLLLSKKIPIRELVNQPIACGRRPHPDTEIYQDDIRTEPQIPPRGRTLMDLLAGGEGCPPARSSRNTRNSIQPPCSFVTHPHAGLEVPSFPLARPAQRAPDNRIDVDLETSELLLDDRPDFERHRILGVRFAREADLDADAYFHRQPPRFGQSPSRANAPAGVFITAAGPMRHTR